MGDPNTVAIVDILRQGYGRDLELLILNDGLSQAALTDAHLRLPLKNGDVKLIGERVAPAMSSTPTLVHPRISIFMIVPNRCTSLT
jgi:hypothetical protein